MIHKLFRNGLIISLAMLVLTLNVKAQRSLNRDSIDAKYKWNLTDIYPSWDEWEKGMTQIEGLMNKIAGLKGTLTQGPEQLLHALKLNDEMGKLSYLIYKYPQFHRVINAADQQAGANMQRVGILFSKFGTATAWINPEMLTIPWETMKQWLDETPGLAPFRFGIEDLYRQQAHVLNEDKEKLISYYSSFNGTPRTIYEDLSIAGRYHACCNRCEDGQEGLVCRQRRSKKR